ncbi:MAG TPA: ThiF family adenylyltransferase [Spirochaetia bacterium]|nr:ThiF family adenylyltransferase [Spirochaetia bacterium]
MNFSRQTGIVSPIVLQTTKVTDIGVGGIGTLLGLTLGKMGVGSLVFLDDDTVESHNIPNQLFRLADTGRPKVEAFKEMLGEFTDSKVETVQQRFDGSQPLNGVVMSAVDSMAARKVIWEKIRFNIHVPLYVEGRMAAEVFRVYTLDPNDLDMVEAYEKTLYSDQEAVVQPCTQKSIIYTAMVIGGIMAGQLKKWLVGEQYYFLINMDLKNMLLVVK